jgi:hypothetical protein
MILFIILILGAVVKGFNVSRAWSTVD